MSTTDITKTTTGTWAIDPAHSEIGFSVRHLMVSKVRGRFSKFEGTINVGESPESSTAHASIEMSSISTGDATRDGHLTSPDFFEVEKYPTMTFASTSVTGSGEDYTVAGDLTIHGVTRPVQLTVEYNGVGTDPWGGTRMGLSAETEISRKDFGIDIEMPLDGGGVVVGDKIKVTLEVEAVLQAG